MITATIQQTRQKFETLPDLLREAIFSTENADILADISRKNSLDFTQASVLSELLGLVFLGFLKIDDVASQFKEYGRLDDQKSSEIVDQLKSRILNRYADYLEHALRSEPEISSAKFSGEPAPAAADETPAPIEIEGLKSSPDSEKTSISEPAPESLNEMPAAPEISAPAPEALSSAAAAPPPTVEAGPEEKKLVVEPEIENIPTPVMLHEEAESKPLEIGLGKNVISFGATGYSSGDQFRAVADIPRPPAAAQIELGESDSGSPSPAALKPEAPAPRPETESVFTDSIVTEVKFDGPDSGTDASSSFSETVNIPPIPENPRQFDLPPSPPGGF